MSLWVHGDLAGAGGVPTNLTTTAISKMKVLSVDKVTIDADTAKVLFSVGVNALSARTGRGCRRIQPTVSLNAAGREEAVEGNALFPARRISLLI